MSLQIFRQYASFCHWSNPGWSIISQDLQSYIFHSVPFAFTPKFVRLLDSSCLIFGDKIGEAWGVCVGERRVHFLRVQLLPFLLFFLIFLSIRNSGLALDSGLIGFLYSEILVSIPGVGLLSMVPMSSSVGDIADLNSRKWRRYG